ncbi:hypothetical protein MTR67_020121 [Solanum verrucosum]|uniref:Uncharacterized protein n=1 Tax=Solanum verrucosum TaxID=315347 RepID=A0AAF0TNW2_SOLVR|nr:hypothetical protein MTR67_020121 [Solanum verrucosum]
MSLQVLLVFWAQICLWGGFSETLNATDLLTKESKIPLLYLLDIWHWHFQWLLQRALKSTMHSNGMVNLVNKFFEMQQIDALRPLGYIHRAGQQIPSEVTGKDLNTESWFLEIIDRLLNMGSFMSLGWKMFNCWK